MPFRKANDGRLPLPHVVPPASEPLRQWCRIGLRQYRTHPHWPRQPRRRAIASHRVRGEGPPAADAWTIGWMRDPHWPGAFRRPVRIAESRSPALPYRVQQLIFAHVQHFVYKPAYEADGSPHRRSRRQQQSALPALHRLAQTVPTSTGTSTAVTASGDGFGATVVRPSATATFAEVGLRQVAVDPPRMPPIMAARPICRTLRMCLTWSALQVAGYSYEHICGTSGADRPRRRRPADR